MDIAAFFSYVFVTTYTPGPNNIMSMRNGNHYGYRGSLGFLLGITAGFFVLMLASGLFNLFLSDAMPMFLPVMKWGGAIYMLYLALIIFQDGKGGNDAREKTANSFLAGLFLQFANVKVILYGLTVTANFVVPYTHSWLVLSAFAAFLALVGFSAISCWALFGALFQKWLGQYRKPFNWVMALLLGYSSAAILGAL